MLSIKSDQWQLQRFREAYLFGILSVPDAERPRVADRIRALCEAQFSFLRNARTIYKDYEPSDFESHVEFVNRIYKETPKLILPPGDAERTGKSIDRTWID